MLVLFAVRLKHSAITSNASSSLYSARASFSIPSVSIMAASVALWSFCSHRWPPKYSRPRASHQANTPLHAVTSRAAFPASEKSVGLNPPKGKGGRYYIAASTKSGKPRTIEPPPIAFEYLRAERVKQLEHRLKAGPIWSNPDDLVFTDEAGKHLTFFMFYRRFKAIAAGIGRPDARPHDLRHTAATVAIASGADVKSVQELLGHATASFTLNVYAHTSEQMMKDTAARMKSYYDGLAAKG